MSAQKSGQPSSSSQLLSPSPLLRKPFAVPWGGISPELRGRISPEAGMLWRWVGVWDDCHIRILSRDRRRWLCHRRRCPEPSSAAAVPRTLAAQETLRVCGFLASCTLWYFCKELEFDVSSVPASSLPEPRADTPPPPPPWGSLACQPPPPAPPEPFS